MRKLRKSEINRIIKENAALSNEDYEACDRLADAKLGYYIMQVRTCVCKCFSEDWTAPNVTLTASDNTSRFDSLQIIHDLCIDYDGFNTVDGLKSLIDDIRAITEEALK